MTAKITNGVLIGLHYHKAGQYRSLRKTTGMLAALLLVVVVISLAGRWGDGGLRMDTAHRPGDSPALVSAGLFEPSSPSDFLLGYVGRRRILADVASFPSPPKGLPESGFVPLPAPGGFQSAQRPDKAPAPLSTDSNFGLPEQPPLWRFTERGLPAGVVDQDISLVQPPHAVLASPVWPARVGLVDDTAIVEGFLTFQAQGRLSFDLVSESHPGLGFGAAVRTAIDQSTCFPSVDKSGRRITVSCRYRCLFVPGGQSSVSVGPSVTAIIKKD